MKKFYLLTAMASLMLGAAALPAEAQQVQPYQNPIYGADSASRVRNALNYNYLSDKYKARDYDGAIELLSDLMVQAPKISQNIYIYGINIYRTKIAGSKSVAERNTYVDSLMTVYDKRAENYGDNAERGKGYIMTLKALDFLNYKPTDRDGIRDLFCAAIEESGSTIDPNAVAAYFNAATTDYKNMVIETEFYLNEYDRLTTVFDGMAESDDLTKSKETFEALFIGSGAADCTNLEKLFRPRFEATPEDTVMLAKAVSLMTRNQCTGDLVTEMGEAYYAVSPSATTAMLLASAFEEKQNYEKSRQYLTEAIAVETDPTQKANLAMRIAGSELGAGNAREAADFARQAIEINPESGYAYLILANAYGMGSNSCSGFDSQAVSWLVVDLLGKAKTLLADDAKQVETINELISSYYQRFPSDEECFFRNLSNGSSFSVRCGWISGSTLVRVGN
ncbi:MAG: enzyme of heme biosynthesis [Rikenellaceae bacterium]